MVAHIDAALAGYAALIAGDYAGYRNHACRVASFCMALSGRSADDAEVTHKVGIAAALHDVGIWTAGTFDYLAPSVEAATAYLERAGRAGWTPEITAMIRDHHKLTRSRGPAAWLVEPFRKADWVDVSGGRIRCGLPRHLVRAVLASWPDAGFHRRLLQLSLERLRTHPWQPLPMVRL